MAQPFMLSLLGRQLSMLGDRFLSRYPHPWLVWEPSDRVRAASADDADLASTRMPKGGYLVPEGSDALCYPLNVAQVTVGRATTNEISIDDLSMSRVHFLLYSDKDTWYLALAEPVTCATFVRRMSVQPRQPVFLVDCCQILAGDVKLTFYAAGSFVDRVRDEMKRQAVR